MATRKHFNGKNAETPVTINEETEITSTVETGETASTELETVKETEEAVSTAETGETASIELETENNDIPTDTKSVEVICSGCDDLDIDGLKQVIDYCSNRIDELQREEVEELEAQMRVIQDKLIALNGHKGKVNGNGTSDSGKKRTDTPLVNPNNPKEVYTFGKHPDWLAKLMAETNKTVSQLREEAKG